MPSEREQLKQACEVILAMDKWKSESDESTWNRAESLARSPHTARELADAIRFFWPRNKRTGGLINCVRDTFEELKADDGREPIL